jgi:hypothetical protein
MKLGVTTGEETQRIVRRYGGDVGRQFGVERCEEFAPFWKPYDVDVESGLLNRIGARDLSRSVILRHFGASVWRVSASFGVDDRGRLTCVDYQVISIPAHAESAQLSAQYSLPYSSSDSTTYEVGYTDVHYVRRLSAVATTNGTAEEQRSIFDFDLDCLTRIGGCRTACEVMPSAWLEYQRRAREDGLPRSADQSDPRCRALRLSP